MKTIYISGPMTGYPRFNFDAFDEAEWSLLQAGWRVLSPATMDREAGFDPDSSIVDAEFLADALTRDMDAIKQADAIVMLPGWEKSTGANAEMWMGRWRKLPVYAYPNMELIEPTFPDKESPAPSTGGVDPKASCGDEKCPMHLLPPTALMETAWVHGSGANKYGAYNWRYGKGIKLHTYVAAIMRHLMLMACGQWEDKESGYAHAAHIAATCNILMDADAHDMLDDEINDG